MVEQTDSVDPREGTHGCRRAAVRYRGNPPPPAHLAGATPDAGRPAWVYNLSTTGIGLLLDGPVLAATPLEIDLVTSAGARVTLRGRPVHATRRLDGRWLVGYQLCQPLTAEELEALLPSRQRQEVASPP